MLVISKKVTRAAIATFTVVLIAMGALVSRADWNFTVTDAVSPITVQQAASGVFVRENSLTPMANFTIWTGPNAPLSGQAGTVQAAGSTYSFVTRGTFTVGQIIGYIQAGAAGPFTFVGVAGNSSLPDITNLQGRTVNPAAPSSTLNLLCWDAVNSWWIPGACAAAAWSSLTPPIADLTVPMGTHTTTFSNFTAFNFNGTNASTPGFVRFDNSSSGVGNLLQVTGVGGASPVGLLFQAGNFLTDGAAWQIGMVQGANPNFVIGDQVGLAFRKPFSIEQGGPANTMYLASTGNIGIGIATPASILHLQANSAHLSFQSPDSGNEGLSLLNATGFEVGIFVQNQGSGLWTWGTGAVPDAVHMLYSSGFVGFASSNPGSMVTVNGGDVYVPVAANGLILKDTIAGTCSRIQLTSAALVATPLACPSF